MSKRIRVAVIAGGRSSEHEISVASARSVIDGLDPDRYDVQTIQIHHDGRWQLGPGDATELERPVAETLPVPTGSPPELLGQVEVVLPILHGPFGEDGTVQGLLELAGVPYVGAGVTASALCMDKDPVFVKPARLGSSVGISKVGDESELQSAVDLARRHDEKVLIEEFVPGVEVEVGVLGNKEPIASVPGEIVAHGFSGVDWYDYSAKYDVGGMDLVIPPRIPEDKAERVQQLAVEAFVATDCEGMARADCFVRDDGEVLVNELNTIPGFTATSVYAKLFEESGIPYPELLDRLVELALERHERRGKLEF